MAGWAIVWQIVVWLVTTAISASQMKVPKGGPAAGSDKFKFPTASEDRAVPVIFGPRWVKGPNVVWWGNLKNRAIKQSAGRKYAFFGPKRYTVINYIYSLGMQLIVAYKADRIMAARIGEKVLAEGLSVTSNGTISVNKPELFGGEKAGGGFVGPIDFEFGLPGQGVNAYLDGLITGPVSAHRGVVGIILRDCEITAAPPGQEVNIQPVSVLLSATSSMCSWYGAKVTCPSGGMNPAHMLRVVATRQPWNNQQYSDLDIDDASFTAAADVLFAEDFGLAAEISDEAISADDAIGEILRHIDGTLFEDRFSGKLSLTLNRGGYDIPSLPVFDDSCVLSVDEYTRLGWGERINQVTISYYDLQADKDRSTTPIYDPAAEQAQGGVVARVNRYPWIFQGEIAARLGERDLRQMTADLGVATIVANRKASGIKPGSVFRWSCPKLGITQIVMRAKRVDYGSLADGRVRIICVEDIFSLPTAVYAEPPPSGWVDPVNDPAPAAVRSVFEAPFWLTGPGAFDPPTDGTLLALAVRPTNDATDFEFWAGTPYAEVLAEPGAFSESTTLSAAVSAGSSTLTVAPGISASSGGQLAKIDDEIVRIDAVAASLTVSRGMLDTVPAPHALGARLIVFEDNVPGERFANGASVSVKLLPATIRGRLPLASAPADTVVMAQRHLRPYPPGNFRINGAAFPATSFARLAVSWAHRDRLQQLAQPLTTQTDPNIGPEAGVTYTRRIYQRPSTLLDTQAGITGTATTDYIANVDADLRIEVEAVRGGLVSLFKHSHVVTVEGASKITNGTFATDTDWNKGTGWAIAAGVATKTAGTASDLTQAEAFVAGGQYLVEYTLSGVTAGTVEAQFAGGSAVNGATRNANGSYSETLTAMAGNNVFRVAADAAFAGSVHNVSVRRLE